MIPVMKLTFLPTGGLFIRPSFGGSVASAKAPRVSMIKFTQSIWTAVSGADPVSYLKGTLGSTLGKNACQKISITIGSIRKA